MKDQMFVKVEPLWGIHFRYCIGGLLRGAKRPQKRRIQNGSLDSLRAEKKESPTEWIALTLVKGVAGENSCEDRNAPGRKST